MIFIGTALISMVFRLSSSEWELKGRQNNNPIAIFRLAYVCLGHRHSLICFHLPFAIWNFTFDCFNVKKFCVFISAVNACFSAELKANKHLKQSPRLSPMLCENVRVIIRRIKKKNAQKKDQTLLAPSPHATNVERSQQNFAINISERIDGI